MSDEFVYMNASDVVFGVNSTSADWRIFLINKILKELSYNQICDVHHDLKHKYGVR